LPVLLSATLVMAQPKAMEGVASIQGKKLPAAVLEIPYSSETVEGAVEEYFAGKGFKAAKSRDYQLFRNVPMGDGGENFDVYVKAERKSRREKESSVIYFVMGHPNEILGNRAAGERYGVEEARAFLDDFTPQLEDYNIRQEIIAAEEDLKKMEKKQAGLLSDSTDLAKRKQQLEDKIQQNGTALRSQAAEVEKQKTLLEATKARRKQP
ncbi:MAG: hypothetical protein QM664_15225, partial [Flavihumibacter sp.]